MDGVLNFSGCQIKTIGWVAYASVLEVGKSKLRIIQVSPWGLFSWGTGGHHLPICTGLFFVFSRRQWASSLESFLSKALTSYEGHTLMTSSNLNYLSKTPSPDTITLALGLQHMNFGKHNSLREIQEKNKFSQGGRGKRLENMSLILDMMMFNYRCL